MPHVVLNGEISIEEVFKALSPLFFRNENIILKTKELYLERNKIDILIDSLALEEGKKTAFLALISGRDDGLVVRLYPNAIVEKTAGVKRVLAELAKQLLKVFPQLKVGETNLTEYLES
ncbi:MAG: hypothetical protein NWF01_11190 [Candidatus Bathyarchaeota archaeon]|nr:hypothetical protein [Candidatus Bathyarchaeota archaeon]